MESQGEFSIFCEAEQDVFSQGAMEEEEHSAPVESFDYAQHYKQFNQRQEEESQLFQEWGVITNEQVSNFEKFKQHNKYVSGLRGMVTLDGKQKVRPQVQSEYALGRFFDQQTVDPFQILKQSLIPLSKMFQRIDINLTGNFENYTYIEKSNGHQFLQKWAFEYQERLKILSQKKSAVELFEDLFNMWLQGFQNTMLEIEKCSPLYTLNVFKKEKDNSVPPEPPSTIQEPMQKQMEEEPKQRRLWTKIQMDSLNRLIDNFNPIPTLKVQEVANEIGRTVLAVQSKLQKLQKERKQKPVNSLTLEKKMLIVLANSPTGYTKEELLEKMQAQFEMGEEETWKKSVTQLLSVSKKVAKTKGIFSFTSLPQLQAPNNFKNKVISCLYDLPNHKGNLKAITRKYVQKFFTTDGLNPEDLERVKITQDNIYKTIFKNDIFDKSNSKQVYRYIETELSNKDSQSDRSESGSKSFA